MAHTPSTRKRIRQDKVKKSRNIGYKRRMKTKIVTAIAATPKKKKTTLSEAYSAIDKAAKKKIIHKNTAARKKSRLTKKLSQLKAA